MRKRDAAPVNPIDWSYRYTRLYGTAATGGQTVLIASVALLPIVVTTGLLLTLPDTVRRSVLSFFLATLVLLGATVWFLSPLYFQIARHDSQRLAQQLIQILTHPRDRHDRPVISTAGGWPINFSPRKPLELELARTDRFSLTALWPETEPFLSEAEIQRITSVSTRMRVAYGVALTSAATAVASFMTAAAVASGITTTSELPNLSRVERWVTTFLATALVMASFSAAYRGRTLGKTLLQAKASLVKRHGDQILRLHGMVSGEPIERARMLRTLSADILLGKVGIPNSPDSASLGIAPTALTQVGQVVTESVREALAPPPLTDVEGSLDAQWRGAEGKLKLGITVRTGPAAWRDARELGARPFRLIGGEPGFETVLEVAVDLPGHTVNLRNRSVTIETDGGVHTWSGEPQPTFTTPPETWVALYTHGRFLQAIPAKDLGSQ